MLTVDVTSLLESNADRTINYDGRVRINITDSEKIFFFSTPEGNTGTL